MVRDEDPRQAWDHRAPYSNIKPGIIAHHQAAWHDCGEDRRAHKFRRNRD